LGPGRAPTSGDALDSYWKEPQGHPSIPRFLAAAGWVLGGLGNKEISERRLVCMRWITSFCYGFTLVMLYVLLRYTHGRVTAWFTVISYFFMPHVFGHAHFAVTETPMVLLTVLVVYAFLRGLRSGWWAVATGILFGFALATKVNALLLPVILLPWAFLFQRNRSVNNFYSMFLLGPLVMVLVWPWLWDKPIEHFLSYLQWNFGHQTMRTLYFNVLYDSAPWHYPVVLTALTLPPVALFLIIVGSARSFRAPRGMFMGLLYLWAAAVPILAMMTSPAKYDGVRLFLPAFPLLAALAGIGASVLVRIAAFFDRPTQRLPRGQAMLYVILVAVIINGFWALLSVKPYYLCYYNSFIGGTKGAYARGMEMTYWCEALNKDALDQVNSFVPNGSTLMPLAFNDEILLLYHRWGLLKKGIQVVTDRGPADFHLLQYRRGIFARPEWTLFEDYRPLIVFGPSGVPLIGLYETGPEFDTRWPLKPKR
jgi:4-amino-4-deoxy-L-arabinose transferase-like glycosyltransferase